MSGYGAGFQIARRTGIGSQDLNSHISHTGKYNTSIIITARTCSD